MTKLAILKASRDAIPDGAGFAAGIQFLSTPDKFKTAMKAAYEWSHQAIRVVREAAEPNPWKDADDETIAGELLRQIDERERKPAVPGAGQERDK